MFIELLLLAWSAAGLVWWILAWRLVMAAERKGIVPEGNGAPRCLTIFKPLPPLGARGLCDEAAGVESFIAQLDEDTELLLGIHETDRAVTDPFVDQMRQRYPKARLVVVYRSEPDDMANPKIAWQKILAPHAQGELWLWSDADIMAPSDFLRIARSDYERGGAAMITFPYVIRDVPSSPALLETLFVNVEFYPGLLLLRNRGPVDFGLGAGMLFSRADFESKVNWQELGSWLADDFHLGRKLTPVRIATTTLATVAGASTWSNAFLHDMRWSKTIRWNRPGGYAARIMILPVLGWLIYLIFHANLLFAWLGFLGMVQLDLIFAVAICREMDCQFKVRNLLAMELWSIWRILVWLGCWLPWPVNWRGQVWWGPRWTKH